MTPQENADLLFRALQVDPLRALGFIYDLADFAAEHGRGDHADNLRDAAHQYVLAALTAEP